MHKILETEWDQFKKENEKAMRQEGINDIDSLIEESLQAPYEEQYEYYLRQEQEELESAMYFYEESKNAIICVNCQKATLVPSQMKGTSIATCPNCGFYSTESCLTDIVRMATEHGADCQGSISFSLEPGTDNTIIAVCNICDLWNMFYM
jgi:DNA-directed RNA polymerase subunit RPC12/RpoP